MKITWNDISSNIVYSKLTGEEPNPLFEDIIGLLKYWIPSIIQDTKVTINNNFSYYYDSKNKNLWIDHENICQVFVSKYGMVYSDIQTLITGYVVSTHNIVVSDSREIYQKYLDFVVSTHNIVVSDTYDSVISV
jgi:hypothetical protein